MHVRLPAVFGTPLVFAIQSRFTRRSGTPATRMRLGLAPTPLLHSASHDSQATTTPCTCLLILHSQTRLTIPSCVLHIFYENSRTHDGLKIKTCWEEPM